MSACLVCSGEIEPFMSFGRMPFANGFLSREEFNQEPFFDLAVGCCPACGMTQLAEQVDPKRLFRADYPFFSSTSVRMTEHFKRFAEGVRSAHLDSPDPFVVELGSNDGVMLQHFMRAGVRHLGIEPSAGVAETAMKRGVRTVVRFFDERLARDILAGEGPADALLGANVMCHIPDLGAVARGADVLLKPRGVLIFEDPYWGDVLERTSYDQIYDEHVFYFLVHSVHAAFSRYGFEVVDVRPQEVHGGSMRYVVARQGVHPVSDSVRTLLKKEKDRGWLSLAVCEEFRRNVERSRDELVKLLKHARREGSRVVGYAATSKSTTVINYCGITPEWVEFISDTTPAKQGKYSPGAHIPIRPYEDFKASHPDYALLFAWNHAREVMDKETSFVASGGKWIVYVPEVGVLQ